MSEPYWVPLGAGVVPDLGGEVAYQEWIAQVSITATSEATAQQVVAAPAFTADGSSTYLVEFYAPACGPPGTSGQSLNFILYLDGVSLGLLGVHQGNSANAFYAPSRQTRRIVPAAGSRTFSVRAFVSTGTGLVFGGPGGVGQYVPGFIRVTRVPALVTPPGSSLVPPRAVVTTLPPSPADGQEVVLVDSLALPTYAWTLRYLASITDAYKWLCVGGESAISEAGTNVAEALAGSGYVALATPGPIFAVPRAGIYNVEIGAEVSPTTTAVDNYMSYDIGATPASDVDACRQYENVANVYRMGRDRVKTFPAPVTLTAKYKGASGAGASFYKRSMKVGPVRVA